MTIMRDRKQHSNETVIRRNALPAGLVLAALALVVFAGSVRAAPPAVNDMSDPNFKPGALDKAIPTHNEAVQNGAASLFVNGFPNGGQVYSELVLLSAGEPAHLWTFFDPNVVRSIPPTMLASVKDNTGMTQEIGDQEQDAYYTMLIFSNRTSPAALDKAGRDNKGADWAHVFRNPEDYRGEIVHFEGKLKKLQKFKPQPMAAQGGVLNYYEGYMYADVLELDPVFFDITELPKGLEPGDHLDVKIGLSGYFFKKFRYTAVDTKKTNKDRLAPLVIGRTVTLLTEPVAAEPPPEAEWVNWLGPAFFGLIGLTVAILFAVGYWFRRGDWRVRGRVIAIRHADFIAPPPETTDGGSAAPRNRLSPGQSDFPISDN
jgi:hypothetical protein